MRAAITVMAMAFLVAAMVPAEAGEVAVPHHDGFETAPIDTAFWSLFRMRDRRHWVDRHVLHRGKGALAIRVLGSDYEAGCECQLSEVREAPAARLPFGSDVWYGFSFRIEGQAAMTGSSRWQIGGWKQESNGSPFLAQRFDNGVFHITLESGTSRVFVATAAGDPQSFFEAVKTGLVKSMGFVAEPEKYDGRDDVSIEYGENPILPDPRQGWVHMAYHIKGGLSADGLVEVYANGRFIARATGTIGLKDAAGPTQYFKFGHNRAPMPGSATIYLDNFHRGTSREAVDPSILDQ
jgi:hypothetical protein